MNISEIAAVSTFAVVVALLLLVGIMRMLPARQTTPVDQSRYLMDRVMSERETARVLRIELDVAKTKIAALEMQVVDRDKRIGTLESQVSDLWAMVRGQAVTASSAANAMRPTHNETRPKALGAAFSDDDVAFRDWLVHHFDGDELVVLAANAGMERPVTGPIPSMATALVQSARRIGTVDILHREALDMRPSVEDW